MTTGIAPTAETSYLSATSQKRSVCNIITHKNFAVYWLPFLSIHKVPGLNFLLEIGCHN